MPTETQTRIIRVKVETTGDGKLRKVSRNMARINKNTAETSKSLGQFRAVFASAIAASGIQDIARAADQFQLIADRIKVFSSSAEIAERTFGGLVQVARFTKTSVEAIGTSFNRLALATKELGLSNEQVLATSQALQQTFRISGATIAEASAATIQLSQGLASGQLRGQELRSVLEQNAVFSNLLAKELGTTTGNLIKFAESGRITSDVVLRALGKNFDDLNGQASQLGTTFGQSITIAIDAFRLKLKELNDEFDLNGRFAKGVEFLIENFDTFQTLLTSLTVLVIPRAVKGILALAGSIFTLKAALSVVVVAVTFLALDWEKNILLMEKAVLKLAITFPRTTGVLTKGFDLIKRAAAFTREAFEALTKTVSRYIKLAQDRLGISNLTKEQIDQQARLKQRLSEVESELAKLEKRSGTSQEAINKAGRSLQNFQSIAEKTAKQTIGALNVSYQRNVLSLEDYRRALAEVKLEELNKKFREGKIDVDNYNQSILKLSQDLEGLNGIARGAEDGLDKVARKAGDVASQISSAVQGAFKGLEDTIVEFTKTGELSFQKMTEAILEDLTRIAIRASITGPLAGALGGLFAGPQGLPVGSTTLPASTAGFGTTAANGQVLSSGNVIPFATGGIVSRPTTFGMSGGRTGLMGEAGPEAILPLRRGPNGRLGVEAGGNSVTVNVINQTGSEVEQQERTGPGGERVLDVLIKNSVKQSIARGEFDSSFNETFGLRRVGR